MTSAKKMALGGMMAALAVVIMCLGGLIPVATFVCPAMCMVLLQVVAGLCTRRVGFAWYVCVSILCALLAPDKEAAVIFIFLGYYPLIKPVFEKWPLPVLWKLCLFNGVILLLYNILIYLLGMGYLATEYAEIGNILLGVMLLLGNATFFLLDVLLTRLSQMNIKKKI